ncbi:UNKNOWN [Stylonychia lemnae]|uniref:Uncharacterized protein n=1 Tax=Stylonychia lemnae TaxID=5949 RepID=A0A078ATJ8_STYLE|nr:UNKNOWN [Stylonychia lemnae]|eukprot:CDW85321.1 UNKNOWN [Stylonychia lemnae]
MPNWTVVCGDSINQEYEQCDDGNTSSGDGQKLIYHKYCIFRCSSTCTTETGFFCTGARLAKTTCYESCGDGKKFTTAATACDDGNNIDGDGCSTDCVIETGFTCTTPGVGGKTTCTENCGDGRNMRVRACDDGNTANGDGCSSTCTVETYWTCAGGSSISADVCYPVCGDSRRIGGEQCDDGNNKHLDGCTSYCTTEVGFTCATSIVPNVCTESCGDGRNMGFNTCDDGNSVSGDGQSIFALIKQLFSYLRSTEVCGDSVSYSTNPTKCDDGDSEIGDGCDVYCNIEPGWFKSGFSYKEICGDGRNYHSYSFECDDGNTIDGDGCSSVCVIENGYLCEGGDSSTQDVCSGECGDGTVIGEQCDDGNLLSGDGCDCKCKIEAGFTCSGGSSTTASKCTEICGDGKSIGFYQCDDGNTVSGDGCSNTCTVESGWTCTNYPRNVASVCTEVCGDGTRNGIIHQCDDGNVVSGDGCSSICKVEAGYTCAGGNSATADQCKEICGVGYNFGTKDCDDGNTKNGDGCNSVCQTEKGWTCSGGNALTKDTCKEICGDGLDFLKYNCDDGNYINGDGCDRTCNVEPYYTCSGGTTTKPDTCKALPPFYIQLAKVNANNTKMQIYLTENYYLKNSWDKSKWEVLVQGPKNSYDYDWELDRMEELEAGTLKPKYMTLNLTINDKLYGSNLEQVVVNFIDKSDSLSVQYGTPMYNNTVDGYLNANDNEIAEYTMSSCLRGFFDAVGVVNLNFAVVKDLFSSLFSKQIDYDYYHSTAYKEMGYETYSFLINGVAMLIISACLLGSTFIVYAVAKSVIGIAERQDNQRLLKVGKTIQKIGWRLPHAVARLAFLQLTFASVLDLSSLSAESINIGMGSYLSIMIIGVYGGYVLFELITGMIYRNYILTNEFHLRTQTTKVQKQTNLLFLFGLMAQNKEEAQGADNEEDDPNKPSEYQQLYGEYNYMSFFQYFTFFPFALKRTALVMIAVLLDDQPNVFLLLFVITTLANMAYLSYIRPFREDYINKLYVVNEFFLVVQSGFMVLFCTPFGTTEMDVSYLSIVMLASYMQIVVTVITSGIVTYQKMKALKDKDKVQELDNNQEEPESQPKIEKTQAPVNKPVSPLKKQGNLFQNQEIDLNGMKGLNYNYTGSLARPPVTKNQPIPLLKGSAQSHISTATSDKRGLVMDLLYK